MDACLVVIGVHLRTAPAVACERFSLSDLQRDQAARELAGMEGIQEVVVLAGRTRTEFIVWSSQFSAAADSILSFLMRHYGLRLCEWQHFYRLLCDDAVWHLFRLASGLTEMLPGETATAELKDAWYQAKRLRTAGAMLKPIVEKALELADRVRKEIVFTKSHGHANSVISNVEALISRELQSFTHQTSPQRLPLAESGTHVLAE